MAEETAQTDAINTAAQSRIRHFVERIELLIEEKKVADEEINEIYRTARGEGFDAKILKKLIEKRAKDPTQLSEEAALLDLYEAAARAG